ncbi:MAG: PEP-CTERM sorting domain-containing protein, partial [Terriglobia bacterium]
AWAFGFGYGMLGTADKNPGSAYIQYYSALAVHSGDVGAIPIPEPATLLLLGSGLIGLLGFKRKFRK